jgi:prepilin-type N-terminal cleavage/methylation domain-containing protein
MLKSMLARTREARLRGFEEEGAADAGFTLIELMVVLLIIAILLAIAIPTFLGVTGSANDRAAQSNITNALTEMKALYQNGQTYCQTVATCAASQTPLPLTGAGSIQSSAPEFSWQGPGVALVPGSQIGVQVNDVVALGDGAGVIVAVASKNLNTCWYAADMEATPATAAIAGNLNPQFQAEAALGTANTQWQAFPTPAQQIPAGVFYSKKLNAASCKASDPLTSGTGWLWGTTFTNAPNL